MKNLTVILILASSILLGCSNDSEEDLIINEPEPDVVTYEDVQFIFSNNCLNCHSNPPTNGASVPLTTYNFVKSAVETEMLIERIKSTQVGFGMPLNDPQLPQNLIDLIEQWEMDGLLEN